MDERIYNEAIKMATWTSLTHSFGMQPIDYIGVVNLPGLKAKYLQLMFTGKMNGLWGHIWPEAVNALKKAIKSKSLGSVLFKMHL